MHKQTGARRIKNISNKFKAKTIENTTIPVSVIELPEKQE